VESKSASTSSSSAIPTSEAVSALSLLISSWRDDIVLCSTQSFTSDPAGHPVVIDSEQAKILRAVAAYDKVSIRTGRGVGKTSSISLVAHWWLSTRYPATVVTSAGTWGHLEDKLWPEIHNWGQNWLLRDAFEYQTMGIYHLDRPYALRAEASASDRPENVEGYHSPHLLILIDEAKAMPDSVYAALLASLTNAGAGEEQKIAVFSTPPLSGGGWFARVSTSSEWHTVHISGLVSPRVSASYVQEILDEFGEDSPEYQSFVLGEIPDSADEVVIQMRWVEAAQARGPQPSDTRRPVITCDVAREGEDLTVIGVFQHGIWRLARYTSDDKVGWFAHQDEMATASRLSQAAKQYSAWAIVVDATGAGGGVVDRLRQMQHESLLPNSCSVIPINFGSAAERPDRFELRKDELWWQGRNALKQSQISLPTDEEIRSYRLPRGTDFKVQFTSALYEYNSRDKINILDRREGNREKTRSLPTKSPDVVHSFILGVRYYLRQSLAPKTEEPPKTGEEALGRLMKRKIEDEAKRRRGVGGNPFNR
jgi:phage terminase large subunit